MAVGAQPPLRRSWTYVRELSEVPGNKSKIGAGEDGLGGPHDRPDRAR
jgi:hypothetical protein